MTLIFLGDSLFDTGNLTAILDPFNIRPFGDEPYNEGKPSNGLVLAEAIADTLGVDSNSILSRSTLSESPNVFENNVSYGVADATSGKFGSERNRLNIIEIGLQSQVESFNLDFNQTNQDNSNNNTIEVFISAGSNDVLEILAIPDWFNVLTTPELDDDQTLINETATDIFNNLNQAISDLENTSDNITIVGLAPVGNTPSGIESDREIHNNLSGDFLGETSNILNDISREVNQRLINAFDNPDNDIEEVEVFDGLKIFEDGLDAWENSLSAPAIIDISYSDYLAGDTNLEDNLGVERFAFVDGVHPTSNLNQFLASQTFSDEVVPDDDIPIPPSVELNTPLFRFQNNAISGTYLYAGEEESQNIRANFPNFIEEGQAFKVAVEPDDDLIVINRFQNSDLPGTYLYAGEEESQNIRVNFPNFTEEGIAFYVYGVNSDLGESIYRFQNSDLPGTYLFVGEQERQSILQNNTNFIEEGIAFEVAI